MSQGAPAATDARGVESTPSRHGAAWRVRSLGLTPYIETWSAMQTFTAARDATTVDELWLTEHPPIYTLGLAGRAQHILRSTHIPVLKVDRGGQVTFHGPGQVVAYLLLDLRRLKVGVRELVRRIEAGVIELLAGYCIAAYGRRDAPGVYVRMAQGEAKIAALGLKVRNGCTYHGLALNCDMDLSPFHDIDPCGYPGLAVTQLCDCAEAPLRAEVDTKLAAALAASIYHA
jgi:lipoyl(octanoyl) transferase